MVSWKPVLATLAGALLCLGCIAGAWFLVSDVRNPENACERQIPPFEGLAVESAEAHWPPPLVRCVLIDSDPSQAGETHLANLWDSSGLLGLGAVSATGLTTVILSGRRWRKQHVATRP